MSAILTISCTKPNCHGVYAARGVNPKAIEAWNVEHDIVCPVAEPQPLVKLRRELGYLEECDDPDYGDWERRIEAEIMPLAATAAHHLAAAARTELADKLLAELEPLVGEAGAFQQVVDGNEGTLPIATATIEVANLERLQELVARLRGDAS